MGTSYNWGETIQNPIQDSWLRCSQSGYFPFTVNHEICASIYFHDFREFRLQRSYQGTVGRLKRAV
jgi:hypothetical protein